MLKENSYGGSLSDTMGELSKINQDRKCLITDTIIKKKCL